MRLTVALLRKRHAFKSEVAIFVEEWPDGCEVTEATLLRALEIGLHIRWFACEFLPAPFLAEYARQEALLLAEHERKKAPFREELERQMAVLIASLIAQAEAVGQEAR